MSSLVRWLLVGCACAGVAPVIAEEPAAEKPAAKEPAAEKPMAKEDGFALLPGLKIVPTYAVPFVERGGLKLTADMYIPKGDGPFPGLVLIHGGAWMAGSSATVMLHGKKFAEAGYAVAAINYRKAPKDKFPAQIDDVREAIAWFRKEAKTYKLDPERIGLWGYSAGGHLAALAAVTEASGEKLPRIRAVAAGGAPVDFTALPIESDALAYWLGGSRKEKPENYRDASPMGFVTANAPPFLFFHGADDSLVPKIGPKRMAAKLKETGIEAEYYEIAGAGHLQAHWDQGAFREAMKFFDAKLKK